VTFFELTEEQRKNGFDECNVHDPLGFGILGGEL